MSKPTQHLVGTYRLGLTNVELYGTTTDYGGSFYFTPDDKALPRMKVSFLYQYWREVVAVLLHESLEFLCAQKGVRVVPCGHWMQSSDLYSFHFDHSQFSLMMEDQGDFLAHSLPDLHKVWQKHRPKQ